MRGRRSGEKGVNRREARRVVKSWDIYTFDFPEAGSHPAVVISSSERVERKEWVSVLLGTSQRANRPPNATEVLLNGADGLEWETLVRCDLIHAVRKSDLTQKRERVAPPRRRQIVQRMIECNGWNRL
jgi:mRNA-degrading endonuclease toxin of MazEF toxin-antitoxin module